MFDLRSNFARMNNSPIHRQITKITVAIIDGWLVCDNHLKSIYDNILWFFLLVPSSYQEKFKKTKMYFLFNYQLKSIIEKIWHLLFFKTSRVSLNIFTLSSVYFSCRLQCKFPVDILFLLCIETWSHWVETSCERMYIAHKCIYYYRNIEQKNGGSRNIRQSVVSRFIISNTKNMFKVGV